MTPGETQPRKRRGGIDKDLLEWLACPDTRQPLLEAGADLLARLNERVRKGAARTVGGKPVEREVEAGLVRQDQKVLYPIVDGIPVLLVDEGIAL
jgi:uncharacterized protein YbaR (Trm112 family)